MNWEYLGLKSNSHTVTYRAKIGSSCLKVFDTFNGTSHSYALAWITDSATLYKSIKLQASSLVEALTKAEEWYAAFVKEQFGAVYVG